MSRYRTKPLGITYYTKLRFQQYSRLNIKCAFDMKVSRIMHDFVSPKRHVYHTKHQQEQNVTLP